MVEKQNVDWPDQFLDRQALQCRLLETAFSTQNSKGRAQQFKHKFLLLKGVKCRLPVTISQTSKQPFPQLCFIYNILITTDNFTTQTISNTGKIIHHNMYMALLLIRAPGARAGVRCCLCYFGHNRNHIDFCRHLC